MPETCHMLCEVRQFYNDESLSMVSRFATGYRQHSDHERQANASLLVLTTCIARHPAHVKRNTLQQQHTSLVSQSSFVFFSSGSGTVDCWPLRSFILCDRPVLDLAFHWLQQHEACCYKQVVLNVKNARRRTPTLQESHNGAVGCSP